MYPKNIFHKFTILLMLLASCLHMVKLQAQNAPVKFSTYVTGNHKHGSLYIYGCNVDQGHVDIPDSLPDDEGKMQAVTGIKNIAFKNSGISSVRLPKHLVEIQGYAFYGCKNLKTIEFPPSLKEIGSYAFEYSGLNHVTIPSSIETLGESCFEYCDSLVSVDVDCKVIDDLAFADCKSLRTVNFGEHVENLHYGSFKRCTALQSVVLPDNVLYFNDEIFMGCTGLKSVVVKSDKALFGQGVFRNCTSLTKLSLPSLSNPDKLCSNTAYIHNKYAGSWVLSIGRMRPPKGIVKVNVKLNKDGSYTATGMHKASFKVNYPTGTVPGSLAVGGTFSGTWDINSDGALTMSNGRSQKTTDIYREGNRQGRSYVTSGIFNDMGYHLHMPFNPEGKNFRNTNGALMERQATATNAKSTGTAARKPVRKR